MITFRRVNFPQQPFMIGLVAIERTEGAEGQKLIRCAAVLVSREDVRAAATIGRDRLRSFWKAVRSEAERRLGTVGKELRGPNDSVTFAQIYDFFDPMKEIA